MSRPFSEAMRREPFQDVYADLHTHTDCSDGRLSPSELVAKASARGIEVLAVTDHDTVQGLGEARKTAKRQGLYFLPGIELSAAVEGVEVHILGYGVDPDSSLLVDHIQTMQTAREKRAWRMVERLETLGLPLTASAVNRKIANTHSIGRPHIAELLVEAGHVESTNRAFETYLGQNGPAYVPKPKFSADRMLEVLRRMGAIGVLAHPGHWTRSTHVRSLVDAGLAGIELWHPAHDASLRTYYSRLARDYDLCTTGGSDYHGRSNEEDRHFGQIGMEKEDWERFREAVT